MSAVAYRKKLIKVITHILLRMGISGEPFFMAKALREGKLGEGRMKYRQSSLKR